MGDEMLNAALDYHRRGLSIFPVNPKDKKPAISSWLKYQTEQPTIEEINDWYGKNKHQGIAIVTGKVSNLFVVDLDKYKPDYNEETAMHHFSDSLVTPTVKTMSGGNHLYFKYPPVDFSIRAGVLPGIDYRGNGGYVVAPPTQNPLGRKYEWLVGLDCSLADLPLSFISILKKNIYGVTQSVTNAIGQSVTSETNCDIWVEGKRDENLFHVALSMLKTNNSKDYIFQTLLAIMSSWGEHDEKWANDKIKSAMDRAERKDKNIQLMVDEFIAVTSGDFSVTNMVKELGFVTSCDISAARKALSRRKDSTVEKAGSRDGWWRRIDTDIVFMDFDAVEETEFPVKLPFDLHNLVKICQGNIVLASGEFNAGKTTFALNCLTANKNRMQIRYMSSEMKAGEIKGRFEKFGIAREFWWPDEQCRYVELRNNITALIVPDGLNIIDYLEFPDGDYTKAGEYMRQIHDRLTTGVAIVCNQQKQGQPLPRSGDLILEKPRLAVTLRKVDTENDDIIGIAEVLKAKNTTIGKMDKKRLKYQIVADGSRFKTLIPWGFWK